MVSRKRRQSVSNTQFEKIFPKESQKKNLKTVVISSPKPAILFNNRLVAFYYVEDLGVIEVLQK